MSNAITLPYQKLAPITTEQLKSVARLLASNKHAQLSLLFSTLVEGGDDMPFNHLNSPEFGEIWHSLFLLEKVVNLCNGTKNPFWDGTTNSDSMAEEILKAFKDAGGK
jgi:hypothetical protein